MSVQRRKVFVEFTSQDGCILTTPYKQKKASLKHGDIIDFTSLKKLPPQKHIYASPPCAFYGVCAAVEDGRSYILVEVYAIIDTSDRPECWGYADFYSEREKCFEGTIWNK